MKHPKYEGRTITTQVKQLAEYTWRGYYSIDGGEPRPVGGRPDLLEDDAHASAFALARKMIDLAEANSRRGGA